MEANPETVDERALAGLRAGGVTRVSLGMQSAAPHVLAVLDRVHEPGRPARCARWAREAGFRHVSLDLIYGTPGESDGDWRESLAAALAAGPDHLSCYALTVEEGTALAARIRRGLLPAPDDDLMADRYLIADEVLGAHGMAWYEISNWAAGDAAQCRHNLLYWTGGDWWGIGPGAHSHVGGTRWWNVRHPAAYAARSRPAAAPPRPGRSWPNESAVWNGSCCWRGSPVAARWPSLRRPGGPRPRRPSRAGWPPRPRTRRAGSSSPGGAACWPTPSSAT